MPKRHARLRTQGGYSDTYTDVYDDTDALYHIPLKHARFSKPSLEPFQNASSVFESEAADGLAAVWAAVGTVWTNRHTYATNAAFVAAMDAALDAAGYTAPGGVPLV